MCLEIHYWACILFFTRLYNLLIQPSMFTLKPPSWSLYHDSSLLSLLWIKIQHNDKNVTARFSIALYSLIAFDERVSFWLQRVRSLPCAGACVALFARRLAYYHYAIAHAYNAANTHAQGSDPACWSQKVTLSSKAISI